LKKVYIDVCQELRVFHGIGSEPKALFRLTVGKKKERGSMFGLLA
jgi:hypothetical protein